MCVGETIIFDPTKEELAVAESVLAISVGDLSPHLPATQQQQPEGRRPMRLLAIRTVDAPARLTPPGVPDAMNAATGGRAPVASREALAVREALQQPGVWRPPRGGVKRAMLARMIKMAVQEGGVAEEVFDALEKVEM